MAEEGFPEPSSTLSVRFVVYLPSEPEDPVIDPHRVEAAIVRLFCEKFGGVTAYPARGTFAFASGPPTTEPVTVLETYCEREIWRENKEGVGRLVRLIGSFLNQEVIGCSVDGKMIMIPSAAPDASATPSAGDIYPTLRSAMEQ